MLIVEFPPFFPFLSLSDVPICHFCVAVPFCFPWCCVPFPFVPMRCGRMSGLRPVVALAFCWQAALLLSPCDTRVYTGCKHRRNLVGKTVWDRAPWYMPGLELAVRESASAEDVCPAHEWAPVGNVLWGCRQVCDMSPEFTVTGVTIVTL